MTLRPSSTHLEPAVSTRFRRFRTAGERFADRNYLNFDRLPGLFMPRPYRLVMRGLTWTARCCVSPMSSSDGAHSDAEEPSIFRRVQWASNPSLSEQTSHIVGTMTIDRVPVSGGDIVVQTHTGTSEPVIVGCTGLVLSSCLEYSSFGVRQGIARGGRSGSDGLFGDLIPYLESDGQFGAVVGGSHPVPGWAEVRRDPAEHCEESLC